MQSNILVIDDDETLLFSIKHILLNCGYLVHTAKNYNEAVAKIDNFEFDLIFADIILGGKTGIDFLREIRTRNLTIPVVLMTGFPNAEFEAESVKLGAFDYLSKPVTKDILIHISKKASQYKSLLDENLKYRSEIAAIFNSVNDGLIRVDNELNLLEINEAAKNICGILGVNMKIMDIYTIPQLCNGKCVDIFKETIKTKQPVETGFLHCKRGNNVQHIVTLSTFPFLDRQGDCNGCVMIVKDKTCLFKFKSFMPKNQSFDKFDKRLGRSY